MTVLIINNNFNPELVFIPVKNYLNKALYALDVVFINSRYKIHIHFTFVLGIHLTAMRAVKIRFYQLVSTLRYIYLPGALLCSIRAAMLTVSPQIS